MKPKHDWRQLGLNSGKVKRESERKQAEQSRKQWEGKK